MKYIPFIFIIFIIACEQVVDIEVPEHKSQLVLSSYYYAGDTKITANLTKSLAISNNDPIDRIWGATIKLYENDVLLGQFGEAEDTTYYQAHTGEWDSLGNPITETQINAIRRLYKLDLATPLQTDKTYKITAEATDYESVSAVQHLSSNIKTNGDIIYNPMSRPGLEGYSMDALEIQIEDNPDEDNYYEFIVYKSYYGNWYNDWLESYTLGIEQGVDGTLLLKDDLFEGSTYNVELLMWPDDPSETDIRLQIKSISRDKFLFTKSLRAYDDAYYNPFAEPVIIHTNVENGQGIFSMENKTEVLIE